LDYVRQSAVSRGLTGSLPQGMPGDRKLEIFVKLQLMKCAILFRQLHVGDVNLTQQGYTGFSKHCFNASGGSFTTTSNYHVPRIQLFSSATNYFFSVEATNYYGQIVCALSNL